VWNGKLLTFHACPHLNLAGVEMPMTDAERAADIRPGAENKDMARTPAIARWPKMR
jgi:hypothetical protein